MSRSELRHALRVHGVQLNRAAEALFEDGRFTLLSDVQVVEIAAVSVAELGLADGATSEQITARALESGLSECPLELGPHLRLQLPCQPEAVVETSTTGKRAPPGSLTIASPPLDESDETPKGFYLRRVDGVSWLRGYWSDSGHVWSPEDVIVFSRGRVAAE